jgi:hypothetical protein
MGFCQLKLGNDSIAENLIQEAENLLYNEFYNYDKVDSRFYPFSILE